MRDTPEGSGIIATEVVVLLYLLSLLAAHPWDLVAVAVRTAGMTTILRLIRAAAGVGAMTERESLVDRPVAVAVVEHRTVPLDAMVPRVGAEAATSPVVLAAPRTRREALKVARRGERVLPPPQPVLRRPPRRHLRARAVRVEEV